MPTYVLTFIGLRGGRQQREVFESDATMAMKEGRRLYPELFRKATYVDIARKPRDTQWDKEEGI